MGTREVGYDAAIAVKRSTRILKHTVDNSDFSTGTLHSNVSAVLRAPGPITDFADGKK